MMWYTFANAKPIEAREIAIARQASGKALWHYMPPGSYDVDLDAGTLPDGVWELSVYSDDGHVLVAEVCDQVVKGIHFDEESFHVLPWETDVEAARRAEMCGELFPTRVNLVGRWAECF